MLTGAVIGNVSRTHHPCAVCRALVESCVHWSRSAILSGGKSRRQIERERAATVAADVAELGAVFRKGRK